MKTQKTEYKNTTRRGAARINGRTYNPKTSHEIANDGKGSSLYLTKSGHFFRFWEDRDTALPTAKQTTEGHAVAPCTMWEASRVLAYFRNGWEFTDYNQARALVDIFEEWQKVAPTAWKRSAWDRAINLYAFEILESVALRIVKEAPSSREWVRRIALNGAASWSAYSWGGCSLIYTRQIARRLCSPSEFKRKKEGDRRPNASEDWLDTQARALSQACHFQLERLPLFEI